MGAEEENVAASAHDERDDLATINGIGPKWADAMYKIGIRRLADLAQYTPEELSKALLEQAGVRVPPERIKTKNWIGQARDLAQQANTERTPPGEETEVAKEPEEAPSPPTWRQQAGFSLFFDYVTDEHGGQLWRTRVYHEESGEAPELPGIETAEWVNWILERAKLPVAAEPVRPEIEAAAPPAPVAPYDARIEILGVQVSEIGPSPGVPEKRLMAEVRFQISGPEAETLTTERIPFRIEVHTVDLESGVSNLVASERGQLQPRGFEYMRQQEFPMPDPGRYELHSIVLLLPPGEMMASHRGPIIRVVP